MAIISYDAIMEAFGSNPLYRFNCAADQSIRSVEDAVHIKESRRTHCTRFGPVQLLQLVQRRSPFAQASAN